ncbi:2-hydroxyisoflavanone dehydratase-like [Olea europaea subsp. europaea]|uniref:2-hydroxyisoflavanone dehydratase-like n=1 Tax=Olea europaea subsp. europaea TaxID=158383 RepID=A0A8S0UEP0_OLEEU|nr:2-hydroxyisoflavanone dehydratase-like [Olea europaea subsp. europaea]
MNSAGPKTLEGTIISIENITLYFVPKCTQTEAVGTIVSGQNSTFLTLPSSSEHMKTFGETIAPVENDEKSALGNVPSGTHIEANPSNVFGPPLIPGTAPLAPNHGKTPRINTFPPSTSQTVRTINARVPPARKQPPPPRATPRATATSTTAHSGPKSYAAAVGNVPVVSQAERSQKKEQKRQQASTSGAHVSQADQPIVAQSIASIVDTASVNPPRVQSVAPDNIAPLSAITPALAPSQPVIHVDSDYTDPLAHDMSRRTHESEAIDTVVRQLPGPTPGRTAPPPVVEPIPKPVIPAKDKDKGKAIQGEPRQRWTPVRREQKRQQASTSVRLAPEHPVPACYDDCWEAIKWVELHAGGQGPDPWLNEFADFDRVFLTGDSAGANLSHNVAIRASLDEFRSEIKIVGLNDPRLNPTADLDMLSKLRCKNVLVCIAGNDRLKVRGQTYYDAMKNSNWKGEIEILVTEGEDHVFHLFKPTSENAIFLLKKIVGFMNKDMLPSVL